MNFLIFPTISLRSLNKKWLPKINFLIEFPLEKYLGRHVTSRANFSALPAALVAGLSRETKVNILYKFKVVTYHNVTRFYVAVGYAL